MSLRHKIQTKGRTECYSAILWAHCRRCCQWKCVLLFFCVQSVKDPSNRETGRLLRVFFLCLIQSHFRFDFGCTLSRCTSPAFKSGRLWFDSFDTVHCCRLFERMANTQMHIHRLHLFMVRRSTSETYKYIVPDFCSGNGLVAHMVPLVLCWMQCALWKCE